MLIRSQARAGVPVLAVPPAIGDYSAALPDGLSCQVAGGIPQVLHFIWLGTRDLPELGAGCIKSWRRHCPDWEVRLWRDADAGEVLGENASLFEQARGYGEKSDILRYAILAQEGGIYLDVDMESLQPVGPLLEGVTAFAGCSRRFVESAILGGSPGHPFWRRVVASLPLWYCQHHGSGAVVTTGPRYLEAMCRVWIGREFSLGGGERNSLTLLPEKVFYATDGGYTRHHWAHSWMEG